MTDTPNETDTDPDESPATDADHADADADADADAPLDLSADERAQPDPSPEDIADPEIREAVLQARDRQAQQEAQPDGGDTTDDGTPVRVADDSAEDVAETPAEHSPARHGPAEGATDAPAEPTNESPAEVNPLAAEDDESIDIDDFDFESQEWTLGQGKGKVVITFKGVKFLLNEPGEDRAMALFETMQDTESTEDRFRAIFDAIIEKPTLTDERLAQTKFMERAALAGRCLEHVGMDDFEDFSEQSVSEPGRR